MTWYAWFQTALAVIGAVSSGCFALVAAGDSFVKTLDAIAQATDNPGFDDEVKRIDLYWAKAKSVWDIVRPFLDRLSIYSRPKA